MRILSVIILLAVCTNACTYLKYAVVQAQYARIQKATPTQVNLKHMIEQQLFFVTGRTIDTSGRYESTALAIAAYSDKFRNNEKVDIMFSAGSETHFGLSLPDGEYRIQVLADIDDNQYFSPDEVVGQVSTLLSTNVSPERVLTKLDIDLGPPATLGVEEPIAKPPPSLSPKSLFYPAGTIRTLDDTLFDQRIAELGMYDPAAFLQHGPTMFYALEEDAAYKIPVIFVHGIGGSARSFDTIVQQLDRTMYKPWFFYYPSGGDLDHLAHFFYRLFLSGEVIATGDMPMIVVAHSMGGLIVREAFNKYQNLATENQVKLFLTIASPFGGHAAAAVGEKNGLIVLPAWRDLNPNNRFIQELYRNPLPSFMEHKLIYAFDDARRIKIGENSDGVVSLSSQLNPVAQQQSDQQYGVHSTHVGVLKDEKTIEYILNAVSGVKSIYPKVHLDFIAKGGYSPINCEQCSELTRFYIRTLGQYLVAMASQRLAPVNSAQENFVKYIEGVENPPSREAKELLNWMKSTGKL